MAYSISGGVIINDSRALVGVSTASMTDVLYTSGNIIQSGLSSVTAPAMFIAIGSENVAVATVTSGGGGTFTDLILTGSLDISSGDVKGSLLPDTDSTYDIGSDALRWATVYGDAGNFNAGLTVVGGLAVDGAISGNAGIVTTGDLGTGEVDLNNAALAGWLSVGSTATVTGAARLDSTLQFGAAGQAINEFSIDGTFADDSDTAVPTEKAVKTYVDAAILETGGTLNIGGDAASTGSVDISSQTFSIVGTSLEVETSAADQTITIGLPDAVTIADSLTVTGDATFNGNIAGDAATEVTGIATITVSGGVAAGFFYGDGAGLTNVVASSVDLSGTNVTASTLVLDGVGIALTATGGDFDTLVTSATLQVGTDLTVTGDINANGNIVGDAATEISGIATVTVSGGVVAANFYGNGSNLTNISSDDVLLTDAGSSATTHFIPFAANATGNEGLKTDADSGEALTYVPSTGVLSAKEFDTLSDARYKADIETIEGAMAKVNNLRGVEYNWKSNGDASVGVIAQEVQAVYPQLTTESEERLSVNYNGLVGLLIQAVKELSAEVEELKSRK